MVTLSSRLILRGILNRSRTISGASPTRARRQHQSRRSIRARASASILLLAAGKRAGLLGNAGSSGPGIVVHPLDVGNHAGAVLAGDRAKLQVLFHRHGSESAAALRHVGDAEPHDVLGRAAGERGTSNSIVPVERTMLQIARKVVVLPAPLAPSRVVRLPSLRPKSSP